ncbi:4Fe-4S cluster-binding domain-containing protein [Desulfobulbus sp.]|uniref:4Fe-4S cluster-binding domain-containing protein n=1 Tax=Desulfobulbus sp. TaxID=895 RepID=UPI0027BAE069|nr:4Fe-4S cluster-binding domain-containing protein [Desulfobulbus sp.]
MTTGSTSLPPSFSLRECCLCPRQCGADRTAGPNGFCRVDDGLAIAAITLHRGEEPVLSGGRGICNVFFSHCNLGCLYCQNHQISRNTSPLPTANWSLTAAADAIAKILATGVNRLGFVSPSHMVVQMLALIDAVRQRGFRPVVVYNSNGYDRVETLRELEDRVDVYLPDYKYSDPVLAGKWSAAADYPEVAAAALGEMYRQKGNLLHLDDEGLAERGMIVRHLVLPGAMDNSLGALRFLAGELSNRLSLSLMSQYHPIGSVADLPPLNRQLLPEEYAQAAAEMERLGFVNGWMQECASAAHYNPDFRQASPFGEDPWPGD